MASAATTQNIEISKLKLRKEESVGKQLNEQKDKALRHALLYVGFIYH